MMKYMTQKLEQGLQWHILSKGGKGKEKKNNHEYETECEEEKKCKSGGLQYDLACIKDVANQSGHDS